MSKWWERKLPSIGHKVLRPIGLQHKPNELITLRPTGGKGNYPQLDIKTFAQLDYNTNLTIIRFVLQFALWFVLRGSFITHQSDQHMVTSQLGLLYLGGMGGSSSHTSHLINQFGLSERRTDILFLKQSLRNIK